MDLSQYLRVLWRFRLLAVFGVVLATALALLTLVRVDLASGSIAYRGSERWASSSTVFVTQKGFPLGRSIYDEVITVGGSATVPRYNDPSRFASYAQLYAQLVSSDLLRQTMRRGAPPKGSISASAATDPRNPGIVLPLVQILGTGPTASAAQNNTSWATNALLDYVQQQQAANKIAPGKRVILRVLDQPSTPTLIAGRSKTRPAFIFLAILTAFAALVFILDNLKPQPLPTQTTQPHPTDKQPRAVTDPPAAEKVVSRWSRGLG